MAQARPSRGSHRGEKPVWLHDPYLWGAGRNQEDRITPAFLGSPWWEGIELSAIPLPSQGPHGWKE